MKDEYVRTSQPYRETRLVTAAQWAATAALLSFTVGSGLVLFASTVTNWSPTELLLWNPRLLQLLFVFVLLVGFVSGSYWPVFNGYSKAREEALFAARRQSAMLLFAGLALYWVVSLLFVMTVTGLLQNMAGLGSAMLVCVYLYAYDTGN